MSRARQKGTAAETAIVNYLRSRGFPFVERRAGNGIRDRGDIAGLPGVVIEAKACVKTDLAGWVAQAKQEAANAGVTRWAVWFKRKGTTNPANWYVVMDGETYTRYLTQVGPDPKETA